MTRTLSSHYSPSLGASFLAALLAVVIGSLAGCQDPSLELVIDPPDPGSVSRVALRVWDAELQLVGDFWVPVGEGDGEITLPWRVPLTPRGGSESRWFLAEVELFDDAGCPTRRAVVSGPSSDLRARTLRFEATGLEGCEAAFVDPAGGGTECAEDAPCTSMEDAVDAVVGPGRPEVVYLRGDVDHVLDGPRGLSLGDGRTGEPGAPLVIRAWPGTGTPRLRLASPGPDAVIESCCNVDAGRDLVLDGLDIAGGVRFGVSFNGSNAVDNVVRHAFVHDNGLDRDDPSGAPQELGRNDAAVIAVNGANGTTIEHSVLRATGVRGPASPARLPGVGFRAVGDAVVRGNLVVDNAEQGVTVRGGTAIEGNVICQNGSEGVRIEGPATIVGNTILRNGAGISAEDGDRVSSAGNVVVDNAGAASIGGVEVEADWLHGNADGRDDGDPRLLDPEACVVTLRPDSPLRGAGPDGANLGAR